MKSTTHVLLSALLFCSLLFTGSTKPKNNPKIDDLNKSGYAFSVNVAKINSKYSEIASAVFRNKLVIVSSKKIGGLGNGIDKRTNEPYTDLFCASFKAYGELSQPILFSRILNTKENEGQVAFSPDEHTIYYTRSQRDQANYKLYMAYLQKDSFGKWIDEIELAISDDNYSIENPHVSSNGQFLYFSSNMEGGYGGFDIYKAKIFSDGSLGTPINLGSTINTIDDEKYPHTSKNGKELYFSSKGHNSIGGFDIFISNRKNNDFSNPRNLGLSINSKSDEIAFLFVDDETGVFSSNNGNNSNGYNIYHFKSRTLYQNLEGIVIDDEGKILPNSTVLLLDNEGNEIERQKIGKDASYSFKIRIFEEYQLKVIKEGFNDFSLAVKTSNKNLDVAFKAVLKLSAENSIVKKR
jgi:WD40-like Beta Propeller Repeat